jgi:mono/diheme cytochrome c family protein
MPGGVSTAVATAWMFVFALISCVAHAGERVEAPALLEMKATAAQGCSLTFESKVAGKVVTDARQARLVALYVSDGSPPTPFLPAGPFKARFETDLAMRLRDDVTFSVAGAGRVKVSVNGVAVVEGEMTEKAALLGKTVSVKKGKNRIVLEYASPAKGDSFVRLYWASSDFLAEPVPPEMLSYDASAKDVRGGMQVREGRTMFATLHCGKCHDDEVAAARAGRMPELEADAPSLAEAGARLNEAWLARWISDPRAMRHDATMPRLFRAAEGDVAAEAKDIAAYLVTLGKAEGPKDEEPAEAEIVEAGGRLFAHLRCIGCHTLPDHADEESVKGRTALHYVKSKFRAGALVAFLKAPERHYGWIRMPNFKLSDQEAESLAVFLLSREQKEVEEEGPKGDAARGKELLVSSGCLNCHSVVDGVKSSLNAANVAGISKEGWERGCLAEDGASRGKAPDFGFGVEQREALLAFAATDRTSLQRDAVAEVSERQLRALNCVACHPRDDREALCAEFQGETEALASNVVEEGEERADRERISPDQTTPMLTWAGEKLRPGWMEEFISGKVGYELRPWLRARMPAFPRRGKSIARGLAAQHGFSPTDEKRGGADLEMAKNGMKLVGSAGGFQCVACHGVGEMRATSVFEAPAVNFNYAERRLRKHYYDRWVIAPMRIHKETKMPAFADQEGKTSITDIYDGDARKQYDAIWHYLLSGEKIQPPEN